MIRKALGCRLSTKLVVMRTVIRYTSSSRGPGAANRANVKRNKTANGELN